MQRSNLISDFLSEDMAYLLGLIAVADRPLGSVA